MIRTKTTLVIGGGASAELEIPTGPDLLNKIAQGFDFTRLGSELQTRDMVRLAAHFEKFARRVNATKEQLFEAGLTIRTAARLGTSIDGVLEQHSQDPLVQAVGKFAIVYYTLQAEARSPLAVEPRDPGDLPLRGNENWLFQLSRLLLGGVPRSQVGQCFDNVSIISFCYDRALQHYLPWAMHLAFGMTLNEARKIVGEKLKIIHPFGNAGRLPWEVGEAPDADWGAEDAWNLQNLVKEIHLPSERLRDPRFKNHVQSEVAQGKRLVFMGFGFEAAAASMLFDYSLSHDPDVLVSLSGLRQSERDAVFRLLKRNTGIEDPTLITIEDMLPFQMLRDNALFLEN